MAENISSSRSGSPESFGPGITLLSINTILSVPLNGYVIWLILRASRKTMSSDIFSFNLALSEIMFALSAIWFLLEKHLQSDISHRVHMFFFGFLSTARPLFQCCICVEYYMGVIHPVLYLRFKPLRYRVACCCVFWFITLLSCIYNLLTFHETLYLYGYFSQSVFFFCVMIFCCLSVLWALKRPGPGDGEKGKKTCHAMKRRAFKIILIIVTFMTVTFFLFMAAVPLQCCLETADFNNIFSTFSYLTLSTGFLQPILYLHQSRKLFCFSKVK